jgi:hypothetical protein
VELRRRDLRADRGVVRRPGPRGHRDRQLPLVAGPGRGRAPVRRPGEAPGRRPRDHRAHHHPGG